MKTGRRIVVAGVVLVLLVLAACGDDGNGNSDANELSGIWRGEQAGTELCLVVARSTPIAPGQFSGGVYVSGALFGLATGTLEADGAITIITQVNTYRGTRAGDQASGTWGPSTTGAAVSSGTWTLERTGDDSCP